MAAITNTAKGPRGVLLADGTTFYVEAGNTVDLDVAKGHDLYEGLVEGEGGESEPGPLDQSVDKLGEYLEGVDDADEVQKLIDAETGGKSRKGALDVLNARLDDILGAQG